MTGAEARTRHAAESARRWPLVFGTQLFFMFVGLWAVLSRLGVPAALTESGASAPTWVLASSGVVSVLLVLFLRGRATSSSPERDAP